MKPCPFFKPVLHLQDDKDCRRQPASLKNLAQISDQAHLVSGMEVEYSSAATTRSPAMNLVQLVRVCSQRDCKAIIMQGNICEQCVAMIRSRHGRPFSSASSRGGIVRGFAPPVSGHRLHPEMTMKTQHPASAPFSRPPSYVRYNTSTATTTQSSQHPSPSFAISCGSNHNLRPPTFIMPTTPLVNHFNSRGEVIQDIRSQMEHQAFAHGDHGHSPIKSRLCMRCSHALPSHYIGDLCPSCRVGVAKFPVQASSRSKNTRPIDRMAARPVVNSHVQNEIDVTKEALSIIADVNNNGVDNDGDITMEDIELSYPTVSDNAHIPPQRPTKRSSVLALKPGFSLPRSDTPRKRQKVVTQPVCINLTDSPPSTPPVLPKHSLNSQVIASKPAKSTKATARSLKLCATDGCTGIISVDSCATRCLTCVRSEWKSKRSAVLTNDGQDKLGTNGTGILKPSQTPKNLKVNKKKGVTWADGISPTSTQKTECQVLSRKSVPAVQETASFTELVQSPGGTHFTEAESIKAIALKDYKNSEGLLDAKPSQEHRSQAKEVESVLELPSTFLNDTPQNTPTVTAVEHCEGSDGPSHEVGASSVALEVVPNSRPSSSQKNDTTSPEAPLSTARDRISGWDSDLSDLSDSSSEKTDSLSESDSEEPPPTSTPSGLKIRIPARPAGIYARKCAAPKCSQLLATSYRWKSCVMCRSRSREYQRKKQNLQGRRTQLDEELKQIRALGTPLAGDLLCRETSEVEEVTLVPGARLCFIRNCTYIIPPVNEYRWKMCALCRLLKKERRQQEKLKNDPTVRQPSSKKVTGIPFLDYLCKKSPVIESGRCRILDCGMLVQDSSSSDCRQCVARRLWLLHGGDNSSKQHRHLTQSVVEPLGPPPYPRFKSFSACLLLFKERLAGFLKAQSIFFLFKLPSTGNALFSFDGEYSIVALDFDVVKRKEEVDANVLQLKREIEYVGRIKFSPKRLLSILDGGGIAIRFSCLHPVPILNPTNNRGETSIGTIVKTMQCEMEIAVLPDHSHRLMPGQRTIIRFRLFG
ncbi:hypothetical protein GALMADRAFT_235913 [Galerina marginata CBS 339.88]|uniref:Uncharacterized protein n=1 Tax=Galerina marginata (strain CBS 339.88) TaxID=685588 RepID=A0A067TMQ6_GALM3|nr:hypothetical protein GALMADRAFT_235913 [Galerina marginata CBS 339.88]